MTRYFHRVTFDPDPIPGPWCRNHPEMAKRISAIFAAHYQLHSYVLEKKEFSAMPLNVYKAFRITTDGKRIELGSVNAGDTEEALVAAEASFWHLMPKINGQVIDKIEVEQVPGETAPDFDPDTNIQDELLSHEAQEEAEDSRYGKGCE